MIELRKIIDTWNMIEKYDIQGWKSTDRNSVMIPAVEYNRMLAASKNKEYIKNLLK